MAKLGEGYLGGFSGRLGPAVGYLWNGKWCLRSRPGAVHNPRTEAQVLHRQLFKQEVQLAARMRWAVNTCLTTEARAFGMTAYNLFVSLNQPCFGQEAGALTVDWSRLRLSTGPVAPVAFARPEWSADNVLSVDFEKNPLHLRASQHDRVHLYIYAPALEQGYLAAPVYRAARRVAASLPDAFAGCEVQVYGMVQDEQGRWSETIYAGSLTLDETADTQLVDTSGSTSFCASDGYGTSAHPDATTGSNRAETSANGQSSGSVQKPAGTPPSTPVPHG